MKIRLVAFGIAKDILKGKEMAFEINEGETIAILKGKLFEKYPELAGLKKLSFAIGEDYQKDSRILKEDDEVVILPPSSGG